MCSTSVQGMACGHSEATFFSQMVQLVADLFEETSQNNFQMPT